MRINKYLAECGVASRRACDKLVAEGQVTVNGHTAAIGEDIDEQRDTIAVRGVPVERSIRHQYYLMNKPKGYICSVHDDRGRKTVLDLMPFRLTHPKNEIPKTYLVKIEGGITDAELNRLRAGVELDGKRTNKSKIKVVETDKKFTKLHVTINEGRNRQVRRMFESVGKEITFLKRIKIGDMGLGSLERGKVRKLTAEEILYLTNL